MAKVSLGGLPKFNNNHFLHKDIERAEGKIVQDVLTEDKVLVQETYFFSYNDVHENVKMTDFSYYDKLNNINKIKKLEEYYKASPSTLIDSTLEAYFSNSNQKHLSINNAKVR